MPLRLVLLFCAVSTIRSDFVAPHDFLQELGAVVANSRGDTVRPTLFKPIGSHQLENSKKKLTALAALAAQTLFSLG